MTPSRTSPSSVKGAAVRRPTGSAPRPDRPRTGRERRRAPARPSGALGRYLDLFGRPREIVSRPGACGTVLVVDRDLATLGDCRLVAHLSADEPGENAGIVCQDYLRGPAETRGRCRLVAAEDLRCVPDLELAPPEEGVLGPQLEAPPTDRQGFSYRLERVAGEMSIPALRWRRQPGFDQEALPRVLSLRDVVAALESYSPVCEITSAALVRHRLDECLSTTTLAGELERVRCSPIILNAALRTAVLAAIDREGLSMSELAMRCGRVKRDRGGGVSGETSWLARRIGVLPEGGRDTPTPWIHSDVLALIARRGLGVSPREVELH